MNKYFIKFVGWLKRRLERILERENQTTLRELLRAQEARRKAAQSREQSLCPHIAGCLREKAYLSGRTSIVWHRLNTAEEIGICNNCHRYFFPSDPDYRIWRDKPSFNKLSVAGDNYRKSIKSEPFLCRDIELPPPVEIPTNVVHFEDDLWLQHKDGSPDDLAISRVNFGFTGIQKEEITNG